MIVYLDEPIVGVVESVRLYDPLVDELVKKTMAVFRSSDWALRAPALYVKGRIQVYRLRLSQSDTTN